MGNQAGKNVPIDRQKTDQFWSELFEASDLKQKSPGKLPFFTVRSLKKLAMDPSVDIYSPHYAQRHPISPIVIWLEVMNKNPDAIVEFIESGRIDLSHKVYVPEKRISITHNLLNYITHEPQIAAIILNALNENKIVLDVNEQVSTGVTLYTQFLIRLNSISIPGLTETTLIQLYELWRPRMEIMTTPGLDCIPVSQLYMFYDTLQGDVRTRRLLYHMFDKDPHLYTAQGVSNQTTFACIAAKYLDIDLLRKIMQNTSKEFIQKTNDHGMNALSHVFSHLLISNKVIDDTRALKQVVELLLDAGCSPNAAIGPYTVFQVAYLISQRGRFDRDAVWNQYQSIFQTLLTHPLTDLNAHSVHPEYHLLTIMALGEYDIVFFKKLIEMGADPFLMNGGKEYPIRIILQSGRMKNELMDSFVIPALSPGGGLYRSKRDNDVQVVTDLAECLFADPDTLPTMEYCMQQGTIAKQSKCQAMHRLNRNREFTENEIDDSFNKGAYDAETESLRVLIHAALPVDEDHFGHKNVPLFHPHYHPIITANENVGGISAQGLLDYLFKTPKYAKLSPEEKMRGIPCYLGDECKELLTTSEISVILEPKVWKGWKPREQKPLLGMNQVIGSRMYNSVLLNYRPESAKWGRVYEHTICPFCLATIDRDDGCSYMVHQSKPTKHTIPHPPHCNKDMCVMDLFNSFRSKAITAKKKEAEENQIQFNPAALNMEICVQCGAPTVGHQHVKIEGNTMTFIPTPRRPDGEYDYGVCTGGGRRELIARAMGAMEAYATMAPENRNPVKERHDVAHAAWAAATNPEMLARADEYMKLMEPYETLRYQLDAATKALEEAKANKASSAELLAEREKTVADLKEAIFQAEKELTFKIGLPARVTYNNNAYRNRNASLRAASAAAYANNNNNGNSKENQGPSAATASAAAYINNKNNGNSKENQGGGKRHTKAHRRHTKAPRRHTKAPRRHTKAPRRHLKTHRRHPRRPIRTAKRRT